MPLRHDAYPHRDTCPVSRVSRTGSSSCPACGEVARRRSAT
ncbi:hypothetical protein [Caulobacter sp. BE264]|nr:hypothetical protein [Caulobacter sp. BE264]